MGHYVVLEMNYSTYNNMVDWLAYRASKDVKDYSDMYELVHLVDFLEEEYERDSAKQSKDTRRWMEHEEMFRDQDKLKKKYYMNFGSIDSVFDDYEDRALLKWDICEQDRFHLICDIIDKLIKEDEDD